MFGIAVLLGEALETGDRATVGALTCPVCGTATFVGAGRRRDAVFCSARCRTLAWRVRADRRDPTCSRHQLVLPDSLVTALRGATSTSSVGSRGSAWAKSGGRFGAAGLYGPEVAEGAEYRVREYRGEWRSGVGEHGRLLDRRTAPLIEAASVSIFGGRACRQRPRTGGEHARRGR